MLVDFHSHLDSCDSIVCTDSPNAEHPREALLRCIGLLPDKWYQDLEDKLLQTLKTNETLHLGEVGLDRRFEHIMPIEMQTNALERQIRFAASLNRCISLHCVRETGRMTALLSRLEYRPFSILWHGFTGSPETANELYRIGVAVSIGPSFHGDLNLVLKANPMLALETDYTGSDSLKHHDILAKFYQSTSSVLGIKPEDLQQHCKDVLKIFCGKSLGDI